MQTARIMPRSDDLSGPEQSPEIWIVNQSAMNPKAVFQNTP